MAGKKILTAARLREVLIYNPKTGKFRWRQKGPGRSRQVGGLHGRGYWRLSIDHGQYLGHVVAWLWMTGEWPPGKIDHINTIRTDNRWVNLRLATPSQQMGNRGLMRTNTTGFVGIYKGKNKRWLAQVQNRHLGMFDTPEEAAEAYRQAALQAYGEFAHHTLRKAEPRPRTDLLPFAELPLTPRMGVRPGKAGAKQSRPGAAVAASEQEKQRNMLHSLSMDKVCTQDHCLSPKETEDTSNPASSAVLDLGSEPDKSSH